MGVKRCVLRADRECIECGECNLCDLDPSKICDNCGKCIGLDGSMEYRALKVDGIIREDMDPDDYLYDEETIETDAQDGEDDFFWDAGMFMN
ncbi:MAG: hypothetical protein Q4F18_06385 [Clostridia bacterium]|nr:hypothetical protein [Clostridia bacterium]